MTAITTQVQTPDWVKHAVFYQIFPDRFYRSDRVAHPPRLQFKPWGTDPAEQGYHGGDLYGIAEKLDDLQAMGITALYLNPVFSSASNHRYHTFDYYQVDPLLGGNDALRHLLDEAHQREMYVVLDAVFNHASRGFWAFHHILENGGDSPYIDWFTVYDWPLRPYSSTELHPPNYAAWWNLPALPKFNFGNPDVRQYFLDVSQYWVEFGIDGWRLDVPQEIDHPEFWQAFRMVVKEANPDAYIVGEIWHAAQDWLQGDRFDAVMNYIFAWSSISFFGRETLRPGFTQNDYDLTPRSAEQFADTIDWMVGLYDWEITLAQLNLLDSHDTARTLYMVQDDYSALKLCALFQMTMPGAPCIYYGTETGLNGGKDPGCREAYPWNGRAKADLRDFYTAAANMRHQHEALRTGSYERLYANSDVFVFRRSLNGTSAIVGFNTAEGAITIDLGAASSSMEKVWGFHGDIHDGRLTIGPRDAVVGVAS